MSQEFAPIMCERTSSALPICRNSNGFWTEFSQYKKCLLDRAYSSSRAAESITAASSSSAFDTRAISASASA
jgi:hypothetical protein